MDDPSRDRIAVALDRGRSTVATLASLRNVGVVVTALVVGIVVPEAGRPLAWTVLPLVVFLVYTSLRGFDRSTLGSGALGSLLVALAVGHVLLPLSAVALAGQVLSGAAFVGLAVVVAGPTTAGSAVVWTRLSGGDESLAALIALTSLAIAPLATPALLSLLLSATVSFPVGRVVGQLLVVVVGGAALSRILPPERIDADRLDVGSLLAVAMLVYVGVATSDLSAASPGSVGGVALVATILTVGSLGLAAVAVQGGVSSRRALALYFGATSKNVGVAILVGTALAVDGPVAVSVVTFYVVQQVVGALVSDLGTRVIARHRNGTG